MYARVGSCPWDLPLSPSFLSFIPTFLCIYCRSSYTNGVWRDGKGVVMVYLYLFVLAFCYFVGWSGSWEWSSFLARQGMHIYLS